MAIISMSGSLIPSVTNLALINIPLNEAKVAFDRMYDFVSIEKEKEGGVNIIGQIQKVELENVSFRFSGRQILFSNVNMIMEKGTLTTLTGKSGSGKTTIGQILQKFYDWEDGKIIINGKENLNYISVSQWREKIGVVPQEIPIFNGNILFNIVLDEVSNIELLKDIISTYNFSAFIQNLPNGLETLVGEEGINLSGGQKQIIGLMRVLYKKAEFYILDEPTSALDKDSEQIIVNILKELKKTSILLLITHRLSSLVSLADKNYCLENNTVICA